MKKRLCLGAILVLLVGLGLVFPSSRLCVYGWLHGEPSYRGKPASYWRHVLQEWALSEPCTQTEQLQQDPYESILSVYFSWKPKPTLIDAWAELAGIGISAKEERELGPLFPQGSGQGDPAAVDVLIVLLGDQDPDIQGKAAAALSEIGPAARRALPPLIAMQKENLKHDRGFLVRDFLVNWALVIIDHESACKAGAFPADSDIIRYEGPKKIRITKPR